MDTRLCSKARSEECTEASGGCWDANCKCLDSRLTDSGVLGSYRYPGAHSLQTVNCDARALGGFSVSFANSNLLVLDFCIICE